MAKGGIRGVLMGAAVSVTGLATLSILAGPPPDRAAPPPPEQIAAIPEVAEPPAQAAPAPEAASPPDSTPPPEAVAVEVPAGSAFNAAREDRQAVMPGTDSAPETASAPVLAMQPAPPVVAVPEADRSPAATPPAGDGIGPLLAPPAPAEAPAMAALTEQTSPRSAAPAEPQQPMAQEPAPQIAARGPALSDAPQQPDQAQAADEPRPAVEDSAQTPRRPYSGAPTTQPLAQTMPPPVAQPAPQRQRQPLPVIQPAPPAVTPDQQAPDAPVPPTEQAPAIRPAIGTLATSLVDRPAPSTAETPAAEGSGTPLQRNALPFDDPENRPRMSIILIARGNSVVDAAALEGFPYPLTFAVDAARPAAAEASARYRAAGFEVMALVDLAPDSTAQDAEIAMEVSLSAVPDAVAVMEGDASGFQSTREVSDQVSAILAQRGYGLVMLPNGLNTAQKLAAKSGVPSATVFRDFDGAGQDAAAIRRFLDQGAFTAGQRSVDGSAPSGEDSVIMIGRLRPDTISALLLWGLQDRARRIALAPVSAVLQGAE